MIVTNFEMDATEAVTLLLEEVGEEAVVKSSIRDLMVLAYMQGAANCKPAHSVARTAAGQKLVAIKAAV